MVPWSPPTTTSNSSNANKKVLPGKFASQPPIVTSSNMGLNGPDTPPVLFNPYADHQKNAFSHDEEEERCRNCHSVALVTDRAQGDRVCTSCGVVAEERMMDDRPEWKDFNEAEDIIKGMPSKARSGLVPVDETKYVGGLQPTILSKDAFGENSGGFKMTKIRRQLKTTNKRLDRIMEKVHKRALQDARLERRVRLKREKQASESGTNTRIQDCDSHSEVRPEFDMMVLQEEEDTNRLQAAINADKWSLDRAIFLYGNSTDTFSQERALHDLEIGESREDLLSRMDKNLKEASRDLYTAQSMITEAARKLNLPSRVMDESIHRLLRYITRRDGFSVKGVSSRLPKEKGKENKEERKIAVMRLREYNKMKQISCLGAAMLFLTARNLGWTRTVVEICDCFHPSLEHGGDTISIKPKHCSKAMNEIKSYFPEYTRMPITSAADDSRSATNDSISTSNFADHFIRNLQLPPVAEASVRALLVHCRHEQLELGLNSGIKMSTLCAAVVYFVCTAGAAMQKVAHQARVKNINASRPSNVKSSDIELSPRKLELSPRKDFLKGRLISSDTKIGQRELSLKVKEADSFEKSHDSATSSIKEPMKDLNSDSDDESSSDNGDVEPFDVFTHAPVVENEAEKVEYNMRRMWDAWAEQMTWSRSLIEIEQSCNVSSNSIFNLYKSDMHPRRELLLNVLKDAVSTKVNSAPATHSLLSQTPMASILLAYITTAGALMSSK
jgi:transcription initiation factor TFIIIB Brf1 subunit/transcription initiation factor TFIIB